MASLYIDFNRKDLEVFKKLDKEVLKRRQIIFNRVGIYMLTRTRENFNNSVDVYLKKFEPIKPRKNGTKKPLVKTGALQNSFVIDEYRDGIVIKSVLNYASYHNDGTDKIKKRQFLPNSRYIPKNYEKDIIQIIENALIFES